MGLLIDFLWGLTSLVAFALGARAMLLSWDVSMAGWRMPLLLVGTLLVICGILGGLVLLAAGG